MPIPKRLDDFLKEHHIGYKTVTHPEAYTAQEIAAAMHIHGHELAKSVMIKADGGFVMAVLPATLKVDLKKLMEALDGKDVRLAREEEFKGLFPDCEPGAEPPFGNLYSVETIVDKSLAEDEHIYFNAGNHYEAHEIDYKDYEELVKPRVAEFSVH
ncbi:MAG: YbaK/EbsC family protein [Deltaproteobacteria bacterium]|nr:YbaK/EbsC family protein [Deltaproteobacteria bacterium]